MIEKVLKSIKKDRERGGIELALMLLEALRNAENPEEFVTDIKNLRPDMAVFLNIAHYLSHIDKNNINSLRQNIKSLSDQAWSEGFILKEYQITGG